MSHSARDIERFFVQRYGREAIYLPSGRLALYLAFREWLHPGDRLLLSPVNDDVVFFTVLAAGLVPVLGPLDPRTGNLDAGGVDEATWNSLRAVMTTNLYGIPDRMDRLVEICRRHGILLIEDACQALDTRCDGRRIGEFSTVAAFSLTKHLDGVGGVLTFAESARRPSLLEAARAEIRSLSAPEAGLRVLLRSLRSASRATRTYAPLRRFRRAFFPPAAERQGHRMAYLREDVLREQAAGAGLDRFDRWVRVDNADYRTEPSAADTARTLRHLERFEENRRRRLDGARKLLGLGLTPVDVPIPEDSALFKVPLFVRDRERVLQQLAGCGLELDYIYDPPLDLYLQEDMISRIPYAPSALRWSRDVLPVNPLHAGRFLELLGRVPNLESAIA